MLRFIGPFNNTVVPVLGQGGNTSVTCNETAYVPFASQPCSQLTTINDTGVTLEVVQDGTGDALRIPDGSVFSFFGLTNASQASVRRKPQVYTPPSVPEGEPVPLPPTVSDVTVTARWEG